MTQQPDLFSYANSCPGFSEAGAALSTRLPTPPADAPRELRSRFLQSGQQALTDTELLQLILHRASPRRDVRPLAQRLVARFGDFNRVLSAPILRLKEINGLTPSAIAELKLVEASAQRLARARVINAHAISSWDALLDYCHTTMAHRDTEQFRVLYLDRKNILIADEEQAQGTVDHVPVYPREVVKRALEVNSTAIILVHNHPSGDPTPSQSDIDMTHQIGAACAALDITLHDHIIVGKSREVSFRAEGLFADY